MDEILKNLKELLAFIWKPATTHEEKVIKRYDGLIALCVVFMIGYVCYFALKLESKIETNTVNISNISAGGDDSINNSAAMYVSPDTATKPQYDDKPLTDKEFFIGEIVGIRYFGVYGIVTQKSLGTRGYTYTVRWETVEHDLPKDDFLAWELYRPLPGTVPISSLRP